MRIIPLSTNVLPDLPPPVHRPSTTWSKAALNGWIQVSIDK